MTGGFRTAIGQPVKVSDVDIESTRTSRRAIARKVREDQSIAELLLLPLNKRDRGLGPEAA